MRTLVGFHEQQQQYRQEILLRLLVHIYRKDEGGARTIEAVLYSMMNIQKVVKDIMTLF